MDVLLIPASLLPAVVDSASVAEGASLPGPIVRVQTTVEGTNDEWSASAIKLEKGDVVLIEATGEVNGARPTGRLDSASLASPYCLTFKVGTSAAQYLGDVATIIAAEAGPLKLRVNSKEFSSNKGKFVAVVTVVRAAALPAAELVRKE